MKIPVFHAGSNNGKKTIFSFNGFLLSDINAKEDYPRNRIQKFRIIPPFFVFASTENGNRLLFRFLPFSSRGFQRLLYAWLDSRLFLAGRILMAIFLADMAITFWMLGFSFLWLCFLFSFIHATVFYTVTTESFNETNRASWFLPGIHLILGLALLFYYPHVRIFISVLLVFYLAAFFLVGFFRFQPGVLILISGIVLSFIYIHIFNLSAKALMDKSIFHSSVPGIVHDGNYLKQNSNRREVPAYWKLEAYNYLSTVQYHDQSIAHILPFTPEYLIKNALGEDSRLEAIVFSSIIPPDGLLAHINGYLHRQKKILWPPLVTACSRVELPLTPEPGNPQPQEKVIIPMVVCPFYNTVSGKMEYLRFISTRNPLPPDMVFSFVTDSPRMSLEKIYPYIRAIKP